MAASSIDGVSPTGAVQGGEIQLILGPMFSGKTTELLRRVRRHKAAARSCFLVSYQVRPASLPHLATRLAQLRVHLLS